MNTTVLENRVRSLTDEVRNLRHELHRFTVDEGDRLVLNASTVLYNGDGSHLSLRKGDELEFSNYIVDGVTASAALYYNDRKTAIRVPLSAFESLIRLGVIEAIA